MATDYKRLNESEIVKMVEDNIKTSVAIMTVISAVSVKK